MDASVRRCSVSAMTSTYLQPFFNQSKPHHKERHRDPFESTWFEGVHRGPRVVSTRSLPSLLNIKLRNETTIVNHSSALSHEISNLHGFLSLATAKVRTARNNELQWVVLWGSLDVNEGWHERLWTRCSSLSTVPLFLRRRWATHSRIWRSQ